MFKSFSIVAGILLLGDTKVSEILEAAKTASGNEFGMKVRKARSNNTLFIGFGDDVYAKTNEDERDPNKALKVARAHLTAYDALIEAGADPDVVQFRTMQRTETGYKPNAVIFITSDDKPAVVETPEARQERLLLAFIEAGGDLETVPEKAPAIVNAWLAHETKKLSAATSATNAM